MTPNNVPEALEDMIKDIVAHEDTEEYYEGELLYLELPYYDIEEDDTEQESNWKIEIEL